jgi:hypothetical protein
VGFDGVENEKLPGVFHETTEEDKGLELTLKGFKSPPIDRKDMEVNPLCVIFDYKVSLLGRIISKLITYCLCCLI